MLCGINQKSPLSHHHSQFQFSSVQVSVSVDNKAKTKAKAIRPRPRPAFIVLKARPRPRTNIPVYYFTYHFFLFCFTTLLIHNSLSFTLGLKPPVSQESYPRSSTSSSWTAFTDVCLHRFFWANRFLFLVFLNFFVSVPFASLSWLFCQLFSARKYIVWYRIIKLTGLKKLCCNYVHLLFSNDNGEKMHVKQITSCTVVADVKIHLFTCSYVTWQLTVYFLAS